MQAPRNHQRAESSQRTLPLLQKLPRVSSQESLKRLNTSADRQQQMGRVHHRAFAQVAIQIQQDDRRARPLWQLLRSAIAAGQLLTARLQADTSPAAEADAPVIEQQKPGSLQATSCIAIMLPRAA